MFTQSATPTDLFDRPPLPVRLRADGAPVAIRTAVADDARAIARLAALDSAAVLPGGPMLVAEVDGAAWAAIGLEDGRVVADPFQPSAHVVELLRARAGHVRAELDRRRRPSLRLRPRTA